MKSLRNAILAATAALTAAGGASAGVTAGLTAANGSGGQLTSAVYDPAQPAGLIEAQWMWRGRNYCWYPSGWRGPGYYWCGYAWRRGYGWGGPVGWNGWRYDRDRHDRGWHRGWRNRDGRDWRHDRGDWRGHRGDRGDWRGDHGDRPR